jgi:hypothetical protein
LGVELNILLLDGDYFCIKLDWVDWNDIFCEINLRPYRLTIFNGSIYSCFDEFFCFFFNFNTFILLPYLLSLIFIFLFYHAYKEMRDDYLL